MSTILSTQIITSLKGDADAYIKAADAEFTALQNLLGTLLTEEGGFFGEAAEGYRTFFNGKITTALTTNLTAAGTTSLMGALKKMLDDIENQFLVQIDPALGKANQNAGSTADNVTAGGGQ